MPIKTLLACHAPHACRASLASHTLLVVPRQAQLHLVAECPKLTFYRQYATKFLKALGVEEDEIHLIYTWTFNLNTELKPVNKIAQAFLRIALRTMYRHLTKLETNGSPINKKRIKRDISNDFMSRILAFQLYRRNYYLDKVNTNIPIHRSKSEVAKLSPLGELDIATGHLTIRPSTRKLLKKAKVYVDFNKNRKNTN